MGKGDRRHHHADGRGTGHRGYAAAGNGEIGENETAGELFDRLAPIGAQLLLKTLEGLEQGSIAPQKQNDQESTYASMLDKNLLP